MGARTHLRMGVFGSRLPTDNVEMAKDNHIINAQPLLENAEEEDSWKEDFAAETPLPPVLWGWTMNALLLIFNTWMVTEYASEAKDLEMGDLPVWVTYVLIQLVAM